MKRRKGTTLRFTGKAAQDVFAALTLPPLENTRVFVSARMNEILSKFKPGTKITVLVRTPGNDEADFVLSDEESFEPVEAMIERTKKRAPT